jgi:hypothetical protein
VTKNEDVTKKCKVTNKNRGIKNRYRVVANNNADGANKNAVDTKKCRGNQ